jgi:hypothetical protein
MGIRLIFSFDSEDYITPEAADAEKWWAQMMARHGVTACICVVGELARALRDRGRRDTLAAMGRHEISYHSNTHSGHPTHAEYLEGMGWEEGVAAVLEREASGVRDLAELFGQWPAAFVKPGYSWGPPVPEAMRRMRIPVLADSPFEWGPGQPIWYINLLGLEYHIAFDNFFGTPSALRLAKMKEGFQQRLEQFDGGTLVMYTHPCRLVTEEFWDGVNFSRGQNMPRDHWRPAPLREPEEIAELQRDFEAFVKWVTARRDVKLSTYRRLYDDYRPPAGVWIPRTELIWLAAQVGDPPQPVAATREWLSPAEIFALAAGALVQFADRGRLPEAVALRRPLGPVEPQPPAPPAGMVPVPALLAAARVADRHVTETGTLPARLSLGGVEVGPNGFLQAARAFLQATSGAPAPARPGSSAPSAGPAAPAEVPLRAAVERTALAARQDFVDLHFRGTWSIFPPDFEAPRLIELARWQAWTGKPAMLTRRRRG